MVVAGILWGVASAAASPCATQGDSLLCPTAMDADRARGAASEALAGDLVMGIGAAAVVGGLLWWTLGGSSSDRWTATAGPTGVGLTGWF